MKSIVLIALLAAVGCKKAEKPADAASDCTAAITKGIDGMTAALKARGSGSVPPRMGEMLDKLRATHIDLCTQDKWAPEALDCYKVAASQPEFRKCQDKLTPEQRTKLSTKIREAMMGGMGGMPPGVGGHPPMLQGSAGAAPATPPPAPVGSAAAPAGSAAAPAGSAAGSAASGW
jgi:hypothetical protein